MRSVFPSIFALTLLGILIASIVYLSHRMHFFFGTESSGIWYLVFIGALFFMIGGVMGLSNSVSRIGNLFYQLAAFLMGFLLYLILSVLFFNLLQLFWDTEPLFWGLGAFSLTSVLIAFGVINSFIIRTSRHAIEIQGLTHPVKIAHLSDIHLGHFRGKGFVRQLVNKTNREHPDLIVITGDLFDGRIRLNKESLEAMTELNAPVFFVNGNHDGYSGLRSINSLLEEMGIRVLKNELVRFKDLQIIGLNHLRPDSSQVGMHAPSGPNMKDVLGGLVIDKSLPTILLHHSPDGVEYAEENGVDLYLSGHTHGGQQFPITLLNELLFKYNRGLMRYKNTRILVSEGIGTFGPPIRIGTRSEIIIINLSYPSESAASK